MAIQKPTALPPPTVKLVGPDGAMTKDWYDWFRNLDDKLRKTVEAVNDHETRIAALEP